MKNIKALKRMVSEKQIFKDFPMKNCHAQGRGNFWPGGDNLYKLGRCPLGDTTYKISKL